MLFTSPQGPSSSTSVPIHPLKKAIESCSERSTAVSAVAEEWHHFIVADGLPLSQDKSAAHRCRKEEHPLRDGVWVARFPFRSILSGKIEFASTVASVQSSTKSPVPDPPSDGHCARPIFGCTLCSAVAFSGTFQIRNC